MVSKETQDTLIKVGTTFSIIAIGGGLAYYVVKSIVQPTPQCNDPSSACYQALQPYISELSVCAQEYTQLMNQVIAGQTLTTQQLDALSQLRACMDNASQQIGTTAASYNQGSLLNQILDYIGITVAIVIFLKYGLPGISNFYNSIKGSVKTPPRGGAGIAATIANVTIQFAARTGQITAAQASEFAAGVQSYSADDIAAVNLLWNTFVAEAVVTQSYAASDINFLSSTIDADALSTINTLALL